MSEKNFFTNTHTKDFSFANFTIVKMNFHLQNTIVFNDIIAARESENFELYKLKNNCKQIVRNQKVERFICFIKLVS